MKTKPLQTKGFNLFVSTFLFLVLSVCILGCPTTDMTDKTDDNTDNSNVSVVDVNVGSTERVPYTSDEMNTDVSSLAFIQDAKIGWNLGNQFDAQNNGVSSETAWGNPKVTQELITEVANQGYGLVRIPITWMGHIGEAPDYEIDEAWLSRIAEVIGYVHNSGMKAVINIHHDGSGSSYWLNIKDAALDDSVNQTITAELVALWTQVSTYFKDYGDYLIFETMNEIHDGGWGWSSNKTDGGAQYKILNDWNQAIVNAIRSTGGNNAYRYIIIPGYCTNPDLTVANLVIPTDSTPSSAKRLIVTIHYYDPNTFAIEATKTTWGKGTSDTESWGQESDVKSTFTKVKSAFVDKGYGVYLGECGAVYNKGYEKYRNYYTEYVFKAAHDYGLVPVYWDNGSSGSGKESFGLFNRKAASVFSSSVNNAQDVINIMMKAVYTDYDLSKVKLAN